MSKSRSKSYKITSSFGIQGMRLDMVTVRGPTNPNLTEYHTIHLNPISFQKTFRQICEDSAEVSSSNDLPNSLLYFDGTLLEWEATPFGVGLVDSDTILIFERALLYNMNPLPDSVAQLFKNNRKNEDISFGVNLSLDSPLEIVHEAGHHREHITQESADACQSQLDCIGRVLFQALDKTIETYTTQLPSHLPDFSQIVNKFHNGEYRHSEKCMDDVYALVARYEHSAVILIESGRSKEEGQRRLQLKAELSQTIREFEMAVMSYRDESALSTNQYSGGGGWRKEADMRRYEPVLVLGPIRDFSISVVDTLAVVETAEPSMFLQGFNESTTLSQLINTYNLFSNMDALEVESNLDFNLNYGEFCQQEHEHKLFCLAEPLYNFQRLNGLYQLYHLALKRKQNYSANSLDERDVDALVNFIEGETENQPKVKKKHKKKKRRSNNQPQEEVQVESVHPTPSDLETESTDTNHRLESNTDFTSQHRAHCMTTGMQGDSCDLNSDIAENLPPYGGSSLESLKSWPDKRSVTSRLNCDLGQTKVESGSTQFKIKENNLLNHPLREGQNSVSGELARQERKNTLIAAKVTHLEKELERNEQLAISVLKQVHVELNTVQHDLELTEDAYHVNDKTVTRLDAEITDLQQTIQELSQKRKQLDLERCRLVLQNEELADKIVRIRQHRIVLEQDMENKLSPVKAAKSQICQDLHQLRQQLDRAILSASTNTSTDTTVQPVPAESSMKTDLLLEFLNHQIATKERDLECPVCLDTSETPIYMCTEQHIICANCWKQIMTTRSECVECRTPYPAEPRRHRYMEKVWEELQDLRGKRSNIIHPKL